MSAKLISDLLLAQVIGGEKIDVLMRLVTQPDFMEGMKQGSEGAETVSFTNDTAALIMQLVINNISEVFTGGPIHLPDGITVFV